jgi:sec-independent protein translocase protein TatB
MFGLSFTELLIVAIVALVVLGPDKLPEMARTLGKGLRDIKRATEDLKGQFEEEVHAAEREASVPELAELTAPRFRMPGEAPAAEPARPAPAEASIPGGAPGEESVPVTAEFPKAEPMAEVPRAAAPSPPTSQT